jgi:hypothetical protein
MSFRPQGEIPKTYARQVFAANPVFSLPKLTQPTTLYPEWGALHEP